MHNVLAQETIADLPLISIATAEKLGEWRGYLDWREKLIKAKIVGLRYVQVDFDRTEGFRFLVVCESREAFDRSRRMLRGDELRAFPLDYSSDRWALRYSDQGNVRESPPLGDFVEAESASPGGMEVAADLPWRLPYWTTLRFRPSDDDLNRLASMDQSDVSSDVISETFLRKLPQEGFLALSVLGDLALIRRQRKELKQLEEQSGYAPFLSSYLFDIRCANVPESLIEIPDGQWLRSDLNNDQREAVRKMVSTPDLGLVQGPPGTGKTTMIAEAAYQFVRQGKKVLIASQANLAVDNALERLGQTPAVRAVRLGRKGEQDNPFSQSRTLETFYRAIAEIAQRARLDQWQRLENQVKELSQWLSDARLVAGDISNLRQDMAAATADLEQAHRDLELAKTDHRSLEAKKALSATARSFRSALGQDVPSDGTLPELILDVFFHRLVAPVTALSAIGIEINPHWRDCAYGLDTQRSKYAREILGDWRQVVKNLPHLRGDLARLQSATGDTAMSSDAVSELIRLERELAATQLAMAEDAGQLPRWQDLQRQIKEVKRSNSGLDTLVYKQIFNGTVDGRPAHVTFTAPSTPRLEVISNLTRALAALDQASVDVADGIVAVERAVDDYLANAPQQESDTGTIKRAQGAVNASEGSLRECSHELSAKEARLRELLRKYSQNVHEDTDVLVAHGEVTALVTEMHSASFDDLRRTDDVRNAWASLLKDWVDDLQQSATIANDSEQFRDIYIRSCNVVGVTCNEKRQTLEEFGHRYFDVAIVDEVSKATPTEIVMPLMLARTALLVGDHRQLPPLFKESGGSWAEAIVDQETQEGGPAVVASAATDLTEDNFKKYERQVTASLFKEHFENAPAELKSFLFTQYRMHPDIMRLVNRFYENRLSCGLSDPDRTRSHGLTLSGPRGRAYLQPDQHAIWIDSGRGPDGQVHHERQDAGTSKCNDLEALLIARCLVDIDGACRALGHGVGSKPRKQVGVITFYGRQVKIMREMMRRVSADQHHPLSAIEVDINTVDRYQGQERPIILVSMVRNPPWRLSARANTAQFERINVAFSRAQELLVVVGAAEVFANYPIDLPNLDRPGKTSTQVYRHIIDEVDRNAALWRAVDIVDVATSLRYLPSLASVAKNGRKASEGSL
jgi:hypothetical protein